MQATKVQGAKKAIQLLECCDPGLRRDLQRNNGGVVLSGLPVDAIVAAIKVLAVRIENPTVARDRLHTGQRRECEDLRRPPEGTSSHMPVQQAVHMWNNRGLHGRKRC